MMTPENPLTEIDPPSTPSPYYGDEWSSGELLPRTKKGRTKTDNRVQWAAIGLVSLAILLAITLLPSEAASTLFWSWVALVVGAGLGIKGIQNFHHVRRFIQAQPDALRDAKTGSQANRIPIGFLSAVLAFAFMLVASKRFAPGATDDRLETGLLYMLAGMIAVGVALLAMHQTLPVLRLNSDSLKPRDSNYLIFALGVLLLFILAEFNGQILEWKSVANLSNDDQFFALLGGIALITIGLGGLKLPKASTFQFTRTGILEGLLLIIIIAAGLAVRTWRLETAIHLWVDELNFGSYVLNFTVDDSIPLLHPSIRGFPAIFGYLEYFGFKDYGRTLTGVRALSVVLGTATIPAVYLLGRELFDNKRIGLVAAAMLAALPPHIQFSRLALNNIADPLFGTLSFAFMARAFRTQRRVDFALSGACLGLTQYFYEGGRLLYPPLMLMWVGYGYLVWRPRPSLKGLIIAGVAALLVALPIYYTLEGLGMSLTTRFDEVGTPDSSFDAFGGETEENLYLDRLKEAFRVYGNLPEFRAFYYGGDHPLLLLPLVVLFLLGGAFVFWRWRNPVFLLFIWVVATAMGNGLIVQPSVSTRFVVVFPAMALLIAVGLCYTMTLLTPKQIPAYAQTIALGGIVAGLFIYQVDYFMGPHLERYNVQIRAHRQKDGDDALFRSIDFPDRTEVYIVGYNIMDQGYGDAAMDYLNGYIFPLFIPSEQMIYSYIQRIPKHQDVAFFLMPEDTVSYYRLRNVFTLLPAQHTPYDIPEDKKLILYYAPVELQGRNYPQQRGLNEPIPLP